MLWVGRACRMGQCRSHFKNLGLCWFPDQSHGCFCSYDKKRIILASMRKGMFPTRPLFYSLSFCASVCFAATGPAAEDGGAGKIGAGTFLLAQAKPRAGADSQGDVDIEQARKLFEEHQRNLENVQKERGTLETETKTLDAERAKLQAKLIEGGRKAQNSEKRLSQIEDQMEQLTLQEAEIRLALNESRSAIAQMLGVMQSMGREPPPVMVTKRSDALKMVRSAMVLSYF